MNRRISIRSEAAAPWRGGGFTLLELLVVIAVIAILAGLLLPVLAKAKSKAQGVFCLNNTRQLAVGWLLYADDNDGRLPYNLVGDAARTDLNWVYGVLDWDPNNSDNTNTATLTDSALGPYVGKVTTVYRCPSDNVLSSLQQSAGWQNRVRSYSMNASVGDAGDVTKSGYNINNPDYLQFFRLSSISQPSSIFVFLDEHPDSIDDGYFVNKAYYTEWFRLPGSYHNGAASLSFADGHSEIHRWQFASTRQPSRPFAVKLPFEIQPTEQGDFNWLLQRMSTERN
jgi:prepilin-type N-terminal cleavage/methylation domain-containing protein/prepilin-type processing-associated H-X9-DG protein